LAHRAGEGADPRHFWLPGPPAVPGLPALAGRHAPDHLRAILQAVSAVETAMPAGDALAEDASVAIDEDAHEGDGPLLGSGSQHDHRLISVEQLQAHDVIQGDNVVIDNGRR